MISIALSRRELRRHPTKQVECPAEIVATAVAPQRDVATSATSRKFCSTINISFLVVTYRWHILENVINRKQDKAKVILSIIHFLATTNQLFK